MANVSFQPMNSGLGLQNPAAFNGCGQMNVMNPLCFPQPNFHTQNFPPQPMTPRNIPQQSIPQPSCSSPQIAYVPVYVDAHGRPILQNFLPTVGLNQFMQAPKMNFPTQQYGVPPQPTLPKVVPQVRNTSPFRGFSSNSDSGSSCGSVSPDLKPLRGKILPPGLNLDTDSWANVNERLLESDCKHLIAKEPAVRKQKVSPAKRTHKKKKFGYRSKQNKIDMVYAALVSKYTSIGTLVDQDDVLRGPNVIRLHVKKYDALCSIEDALCAVERADGLKIDGVSIPLSMKNTFQKKGFLVYIRLEEIAMVEPAQDILRKFPEFKKCGVANVTPAAKESSSEE